MNELVRLGGRPVIGFGFVGEADAGDLFAYRRMWDPFILDHVRLWLKVNDALESTSLARQQCPPGITDAQIQQLQTDTAKQLCTALNTTRSAVDPTNGILAQWNAWAGRSSSDIVSNAEKMLRQQQAVVALVSGRLSDELVQIGQDWTIPIELPNLPELSVQQLVISRIESAFTTVKGVLQVAGYVARNVAGATSNAVHFVADQTKAVAEGLTSTIKALPKVAETVGTRVGITAIVMLALTGAGLLLYYVPRAPPPRRRKT